MTFPPLSAMPERPGHGRQRHPRAGGERLQEHVARARPVAVAPGRLVQARLGDARGRLDAAGDILRVEHALCAECLVGLRGIWPGRRP